MYRGKSNEKLLEELLERGYGAEERKKWREQWLRNQKAQRDLAKRRAGNLPPPYPLGTSDSPTGDAAPGSEDEVAFQRRAQDSVKAISPRLRRRIDAYAYRNGYLVTGIRERLRSLFSLFFPRIKDYLSNKAVRRLVVGKGFRWENPYNYCLADNLDALQFASRFLLGNYKTPKFSDPIISDESISSYIQREIASRNPVAVEFLSRFCQRDEMLMRSLEFVKLRFARGAKIEASDLVRIVRSVYRLLYSTGNVDPDNLTGVYSTVVAVHRAYEPRPRQLNQIEENMGLFQMAYANLFDFKHQLFPVLLKLMGTFFRENETIGHENQFKILEFLGLTEKDILRIDRLREEAKKPPAQTAEQSALDQLAEMEKEEEWEEPTEYEEAEEGFEAPEEAPSFSEGFKKPLSVLKYLFPGSGIKDMESWPCFLPYFDLKVYNKDLTFSNLVQNVSRFDPMGQIMVLHRIIDNMLTSLEIFSLDDILSKRGLLADQISDVIIEWQRIYPSLFDVYLKELADYVHLVSADSSQRLTLSPMVRREEENLNQLKNMAIQHYGKVVMNSKDRGSFSEGVRLYKVVEELTDLLHELAEEINLAGFKEKNPAVMKLWNEISSRKVVDFKANVYKPAVLQVQKYIEAKYQTPIYKVPVKAQAEFFDILISLVSLYDFLLNDPDSYFHPAQGKIFTAGEEERKTWQRVRDSLSVVSFKEKIKEGDYVLDPLTGLISRSYWDESLPEKQEEWRSSQNDCSLIYANVDKGSWFKEAYPQRDYRDRVLKRAARAALELMKNLSAEAIFKEAVRLEDNGFLLVILGNLKSAAQIAEDLRRAHKEKLRELSFYSELIDPAKTRENRGTLSIGVAQREKGETLPESVNRVREVAAEALKKGDQVVVYSVGELIPFKEFNRDNL